MVRRGDLIAAFTWSFLLLYLREWAVREQNREVRKPIVVDHSLVEHGGSQTKDWRSGQIQSIF